MSDYGEVIASLERQIQRNYLLGQAQQPDSAHALRYQQRIHDLTTALHRVEQVAPDLEALDEEISAAQVALNRAFAGVDQQQRLWPQAGTWLGGLGAIGLLLGVGLGLPWQVVAVSIVLLLGAAGCVVMTVRQRRDASDELQRAQDVLAELQEQRRQLMPDVTNLIKGAA